MKAFFYIAIISILYTYAVYPLLLWVISELKVIFSPSKIQEPMLDFLPHVSIVISAYNEEVIIKDKIENLVALQYPKGKMEILIGSDGSSNGTNKICSICHGKGINFTSFTERRGKAAVLNDLVSKCKGEIIVFSDANTIFESDAILKLVRHFQNEKIGGVSGRLRLAWKDETIQYGEAIYWEYETFLKRLEWGVSSVIGANGGIYAIRKELYEPLPENTIIDDFVISMNIIRKGYRFAYENNAVGYEESYDNLKAEFKRKVRIAAGNLQSLKLTYPLLMPQKGLIAFMFWSHKIVRWCVPFSLLSIYIIPFFMMGDYPWLLSVLENIILILALVGTKLARKNMFMRLNTYFFTVNFALLLGYFKYILGLQKGVWERAR